jgi:hypothetical protein
MVCEYLLFKDKIVTCIVDDIFIGICPKGRLVGKITPHCWRIDNMVIKRTGIPDADPVAPGR